MTSGPVVPLIAMTAVQAFATMVAYSMSVAAPAVAADLGIDGANVGFYVALVYGVGAVNGLLCPGFIHRYGPVRISQHTILMALLGLLVVAASDGVATVALSAIVIGIGYGSPAAASSHILVRVTPPHMRNLVFSLRQTGVPIGGVLAGLVVPPLLLAVGWRGAYLAEAVPCLLLIVLLQRLRPAFDADRNPHRPPFDGSVFRPVRLLAREPAFRAVAIGAFVYSGAQLCFGAFIVVYLTQRVAFSLVEAGAALAVFQVSGFLARIVWGWVADRLMPAGRLLGWLGFAMTAAGVLFGLYGADWPRLAVYAVCGFAGATASGYTGLIVAEMVRIGGPGRTAEAGGVAAAMMFVGSMLIPALFTVIVRLTGSYAVAYDLVAAATAAGGVILLLTGRSNPKGDGP